MYITRVHAVIPGADAFFPDIDHTHWKLVWEDAHPTDDTHKFAYTFQQYDRVEI
jgi:dihydrofolate reductase